MEAFCKLCVCDSSVLRSEPGFWDVLEDRCYRAQSIEIEKERMASPRLTREIGYEKKAAKYEGVGRLAHKLRQFYEFYLIASFLFLNHHG